MTWRNNQQSIAYIAIIKITDDGPIPQGTLTNYPASQTPPPGWAIFKQILFEAMPPHENRMQQNVRQVRHMRHWCAVWCLIAFLIMLAVTFILRAGV